MCENPLTISPFNQTAPLNLFIKILEGHAYCPGGCGNWPQSRMFPCADQVMLDFHWPPLTPYSVEVLAVWTPVHLGMEGRDGGREGESLENMRKRTIVNFTICQQVILPLFLWWHSKPVKGRLHWLIQESTISSWTYVFFIFWEYIRWAQPTLHPLRQEGSHSYHLPISSPRWRLRSARTRRPQDPMSRFGCGYSLNGDANSERGFLFKEPQNVSKHRMC